MASHRNQEPRSMYQQARDCTTLKVMLTFPCTITHSRVNHELLYLTRNIGRHRTQFIRRTISRTSITSQCKV